MARAKTATLRDGLRTATADAHDRLDSRVSSTDLSRPPEYARFLQAQLAARIGVELWLAQRAPLTQRPPATVPLLIEDLQALGRPFSQVPARFDPPADADPLGAAWAIAGSHLGNRTMLARLRREGGDSLPAAFLADPVMQAFWKQFRSELDRTAAAAELARAAAAAIAVFDTFTHAFSTVASAQMAA